MSKKRKKHGLTRLWLIQLGVVVVFALLCVVFYTSKAAVSVLLGGAVCIIPNIYFASNLFKYHGAKAAKQIVNSFYKGEALKIVMSIFLFTLVFVLCTIDPLVFFAAYIAVQITHWLTPWIIINKQK